jgi:hypothetical protein
MMFSPVMRPDGMAIGRNYPAPEAPSGALLPR